MRQLEQVGDGEERPSPAAELILFVLGAAQVPPQPPLPAAALIALLSDLGLSAGAARSAILRMRRGGWLVSHRAGRSVSYAPSEAILAGHRRRARAFTPGATTWSGSFHALVVTVPEPARAFRDELRRAAQIAGYRTFRAGLLIAPSDRRDELGDVLDRIPAGASVISGWLALEPDDSRRVVNELWFLDELGARYRTVARHARIAAGEALAGQATGAGALRAFVTATLPIYQAIADDPGLPPDLLPGDWPGPELGRALGEAHRAFGPAVGAHIAERRAVAA